MIGLTIVSIVLIICVTVLIGCYMAYCSENGVKMFENPRYEERINKLEKRISELEEAK